MKTIYTAIFGNYDDLKEPFIITPGWKYICFTDQDLKSDVWEIRKVASPLLTPVKAARAYKILFHHFLDCEYSIWIDATFIINIDLNEWWGKYFRAPFTTIRHPFEKCPYEEARSCKRMGKDDPKVIDGHVEHLKELGVKPKSGLISSGILMRKNTPEVQEFCRLWWSEVLCYSSRDQIGFSVPNKLMPNVTHSMNWDYTEREEFIHIPHLGKSWRTRRINAMFRKYGKLQSA